MLADAIRAEGYRLVRNRAGLFWCYAFVPVAALAIGVGAALWFRLNGMVPPVAGPVDLADNLMAAARQAANPAVLFFITAGAASLFAADYRWETWRLIRARNTRANLILAKLVVFMAATAAAIAAGLAGAVLGTVAGAAIQGQGVAFAPPAGFWAQLALLALLAFAKLVQVGMLAALVAVFTRSMMAALIAPIVVTAAQGFVGQIVAPALTAPEWRLILLLPGSAFDLLTALAAPSPLPGGGVAPDAGLKAVVTAALWLTAPFLAAVAWFNRQDLSKE